jgi:hypothetical protein
MTGTVLVSRISRLPSLSSVLETIVVSVSRQLNPFARRSGARLSSMAVENYCKNERLQLAGRHFLGIVMWLRSVNR